MAKDSKKPAKSYVDPNPNADYGAAMAKKVGNPTAVEWQNANNAAIAAATAPAALKAHLRDAKSAAALLARVKGAYEGEPLDLTVVAAVSQYSMDASVGRPGGCQKLCKTPGAAPCPRKVWNLALVDAFKKTKDEYVQTFLLDQLRWCCCRACKDDVCKLKCCAVSDNVKSFIDWVVDEIK